MKPDSRADQYKQAAMLLSPAGAFALCLCLPSLMPNFSNDGTWHIVRAAMWAMDFAVWTWGFVVYWKALRADEKVEADAGR